MYRKVMVLETLMHPLSQTDDTKVHLRSLTNKPQTLMTLPNHVPLHHIITTVFSSIFTKRKDQESTEIESRKVGRTFIEIS